MSMPQNRRSRDKRFGSSTSITMGRMDPGSARDTRRPLPGRRKRFVNKPEADSPSKRFTGRGVLRRCGGIGMPKQSKTSKPTSSVAAAAQKLFDRFPVAHGADAPV